ncbi:Uncharacterized protein PBTT_08695 [Plasmodiophora brassicae]
MMDSAKALQHFGEEKVIQRGYFYCSSNAGCPFHVDFTYVFKDRRYVVKKDNIVTGHNHSSATLVVDGVLFKQKDAELTTEEREAILELAPFVGIGTLSRVLRRRWPLIGFDRKLLYRLKAKGRVITFGSDRDAINRFMGEGERIRDAGGVFDIRFDDCLRIEEVLVQKPSMKAYAAQYGDFTILDGTFKISMYDLTLLVFTNVDCLLKSTLTGMAFAPSERSETVVRAARSFSLVTEQSVLMTDQAPGFACAADELGMVHLLCLHHFRTALFSAHSGMDQGTRDTFMKSCNSLIFDVSDSSSAFATVFSSVRQQFGRYPAAKKFLSSLWDHREQVCATFTAVHFTAGHVATQRGEANNSRIKEGGLLSKDLASYNLHQTLEHLTEIIRRQEADAKKEIKALIKAGHGWSKAVHAIWKSENEQSDNYACSPMDASSRRWRAVRHDGRGTAHVVQLRDPSLSNASPYPTCTCKQFTSTLIPCAAICAVYHHVVDPLFYVETLHPRWWISRHPGYAACASELGLSASVPPESQLDRNLPVPNLHMQLVQDIRVPSTEAMRYRRLDEACKELCSAACSGDAYTYRFALSKVVSATNAVRSLKSDTPVESFSVLPPPVAHHKRSQETVSRCARKEPKKRRLLACKACKNAQRTDAVGHRSNSSRCPLFRPIATQSDQLVQDHDTDNDANDDIPIVQILQSREHRGETSLPEDSGAPPDDVDLANVMDCNKFGSSNMIQHQHQE